MKKTFSVENAERLLDERMAETVAFWETECLALIDRFNKEYPKALPVFFVRDEDGNLVYDENLRLREFFKMVATTYQIKQKRSTVLEQTHVAKWFLLEPEMQDAITQAVMKVLRRPNADGEFPLPADLFSHVPVPAPIVFPDDGPPPDLPAPALRARDEYRFVVKPAAFDAAVLHEQPRNPGNTKLLPQMRGLGKQKHAVRAGTIVLEEVAKLQRTTPNFSALLDNLHTYFAAQEKVGGRVGFHPILVVGEPGIGKTRLVNLLAAAMGVEARFINLSGGGDSIKLRGLSPSWGQAAPGVLAKHMAEMRVFNPIIVLDEIDKCSSTSHGLAGAVQDLLLPLLERETSASFEDEYIQTAMDLSGVSWVATANSIDDLPPALLSRFDIYFIDPLTREQQGSILNALVEEIAYEHGFDCIDEVLTDDVADAFLSMRLSMRELRREMYKAQCKTVLRHDGKTKKILMSLEDIGAVKAKTAATGIGFTACL